MTEFDRPRPRPASAPAAPQIPDGGIPVDLPPVLSSGPSPSRKGGRRHDRSVRRFLATRRGRWTAVSIVAVLALVAGLLSKGLSSPSDPPTDAPPAAGSSNGPASAAITTSGASASPRRTGPATAEDIRKELQNRAAALNNPLNTLRTEGVHTVRVSVTSSGPVNTVGFLLPTSINTNFSYGTKKVTASSYGFSTRAVGAGYLALVFIQSGPKDVPVTCRVTIDGRTTSTESTQGPYAHQICLG